MRTSFHSRPWTGRVRLALAVSLSALGLVVGWAGPVELMRGMEQRSLNVRAHSMAQRANDRCRLAPREEKIACYDGVLLSLAREGRVRLAMATLQSVASLDPAAAALGHEYAHAIGMAAVDAGHDASESFEACTEIFDAGCYHGVLQISLQRAPQLGQTEIRALCRDYAGPRGSLRLRYQCDHGLGHGLTRYHRYDVPRALAGCDHLADDFDRHACYYGALMENITNLVQVNGSPMVHAIHAHGDGAASSRRHRAFGLDPADPYSPCSQLPARYLEECYYALPALLLATNGLDFAAAMRICDGAPPAMRPMCYHGVGVEIRGQTTRDHAAAIRLCALGTATYQPWCYEGVVVSLVLFTTNPADGFAFCKEVPSEANRSKCYRTLGYLLALFEKIRADRESMCAAAPAEDGAACRLGAGLTDPRPSGVPRADR